MKTHNKTQHRVEDIKCDLSNLYFPIKDMFTPNIYSEYISMNIFLISFKREAPVCASGDYTAPLQKLTYE